MALRHLLSRFAVVLATSALLWSPAEGARAAYPGCPSGGTPSFTFGFADLRSQVGSPMGDPIECEHAETATGDTYQRTTTGLALYRRDTNTAMFTNGQEHWALTAGGIVHWTGWHGSAAPPGISAPRQGSEL